MRKKRKTRCCTKNGSTQRRGKPGAVQKRWTHPKEEENQVLYKRWTRPKRRRKPPVQAKSDAPASVSPALSGQIESSRGKGRRMPDKTRAEMEQGIGADFRGVNIHTDEKSANMNRELGAQAFTHGRDIYFNNGKYNPDSTNGKRLLAHELTHVVQQGKSIRRKTESGKTGGSG